MVRRIARLEIKHLFGDRSCRARAIAVSVNRLGTPVTPVRATTARYHIHRKKSVVAEPRLSIRLHLNEIPGRPRQMIELFAKRAWCRAARFAGVVAVNQSRNSIRLYSPGELYQCLFYFANNDVVETCIHVGAALIRC